MSAALFPRLAEAAYYFLISAYNTGLRTVKSYASLGEHI
jgi:hypothetical protein